MEKLDKLILAGLRFYGYHGVYPEEKKLGQWFEVDLEIRGDLHQGAISDQLQDTLNYGEIYRLVKKIVEGPSVNLIEHLAHLIIEEILPLSLVEEVKVRVKKEQAPLGGPLSFAAVEMKRVKNE